MPHTVSVIGLGVMGQRMLASMAVNRQFDVLSAWDPDPGACHRTRELYPQIRIADSPGDTIDDRGTGVVYIACPPVWHKEHAIAAMQAGIRAMSWQESIIPAGVSWPSITKMFMASVANHDIIAG